MEKEGNNVTFFSSYVNNIAIRWNTAIEPSLFEINKYKDESAAKPPSVYKDIDGTMLTCDEDAIISQILIQNNLQKSFLMIDLP